MYPDVLLYIDGAWTKGASGKTELGAVTVSK